MLHTTQQPVAVGRLHHTCVVRQIDVAAGAGTAVTAGAPGVHDDSNAAAVAVTGGVAAATARRVARTGVDPELDELHLLAAQFGIGPLGHVGGVAANGGVHVAAQGVFGFDATHNALVVGEIVTPLFVLAVMAIAHAAIGNKNG